MEYRELKLIKNKDGHGTINYKICLPTKWVKNLKLQDKVIVYTKNNSIIIKNKEDFEMEEILKEMNEEILNKKLTLLEMDNTILNLLKQRDIESESLFDNEYYCMESLSCSYYTGEEKGIYVSFEIVKKEEKNNLYTEVKVFEIGTF